MGWSHHIPANTSCWPNVGLTLGQRRRRWANVSPTLDQRLVFAVKAKSRSGVKRVHLIGQNIWYILLRLKPPRLADNEVRKGLFDRFSSVNFSILLSSSGNPSSPWYCRAKYSNERSCNISLGTPPYLQSELKHFKHLSNLPGAWLFNNWKLSFMYN